MTEKRKQPSGAQNRKRRRERQQAEHEARVALLRAQGKLTDTPQEKVSWTPRPHQKLLEQAHKKGIRRQAHVWHRRAGKSAATLDFLVRRAMERPGNYWYMTPKLTQTRVAIWDSRRKDGLKEIDVHIPQDLRARTNDNMMLIELLNGSSIRFLGSDGFDRLVGSNVHGLIFDEFALGDPAAWDYLAPILAADKDSWALFISTYRGRNHWYRLVQRVADDPDWFTSSLTIEDTQDEFGQPIISQEVLEKERRSGKLEEYLRQEYYNDPLAAFEGAFYAKAMRAMQNEERIGSYRYDPALPVVAAFDLGYSDWLVITFWQSKGNEEIAIGSAAWQFTNLSDVLDEVRTTFPWGNRPMVGVFPHDGRYAAELAEEYGYDTQLLPRTSSLPQEIEKVRSFLGRAHIDNEIRPWTDNDENNAKLIEGLLGYRTVRSRSDAEVYQKQASHTWESHWADSVRYYVIYREDAAVSNWGTAPNYELQDRAVI